MCDSDVTALMMNYSVDADSLLKLLAEHALDSDLAEIQETIAGVQQKIQRFQKVRSRLDNSKTQENT
ncbi:MAG: hypothetical protein ACFB16_05460 [Phormidesmis sp.]